ncbi:MULTISPECIES: hypothetical protein [unclassified Endozoicomonas]|uniref:hypothetical protein n=1 Tax=unclassified Endozoicomonas TaxID=2644528 RepID=UPI003BB1AB24
MKHSELMRQTINPQMQLGEVDISAITFNLRSRDDIPRLLLALQYIWTNKNWYVG